MGKGGFFLIVPSLLRNSPQLNQFYIKFSKDTLGISDQISTALFQHYILTKISTLQASTNGVKRQWGGVVCRYGDTLQGSVV